MTSSYNSKHVTEFMSRHGLQAEELAEILGVTSPAIDHWTTGRRPVPLMVEKILKMFDRWPGMLKEF